jgi:aminomethyltransferase
MDDDTFWFALASSDALLFARGLKNAYPQLDVSIRELDVAPLQVQGPRSKDLLRDLVGESIADLRYYWWRRAEVRGIPVIVTRTGWSSEIGFELYLLDPSRGTDLWDTVMEAGRPYGIKPTGPSDIRRIEGGILNWGADMTHEHNAFELGLERLVDLGLRDDASISVAALRRIGAAGVMRRLVGVELDGDPFPGLNNVKWPATHDGTRVGEVTSAIFSPRLEKNIGYCWLPSRLATSGTRVDVASEWGSRTATVVSLPFVDPKKRIPLG